MYGETLGTTAPAVVTLGTAAVLPATGSDFVTSLAVAFSAGLLTWGLVYVLNRG